MKIFYGIKNGALFQRDESNACKCFFKAETNGEIISSLGNVMEMGNNMYMLTGIPVGGPYEFTLRDSDSTLSFKDVYVGDLWLLGGQSNMEGVGKMRKPHYAYEENPVPTIRAYYMNERWDTARAQLHQLWESVDECISSLYRKFREESPWEGDYPDPQNDGVGPGLYFALEMQKRRGGVPQGLIPCGVGGSSLMEWKPDTPGNYYAAAKRRVYECGGNIKGTFWYQGESQTSLEGCESFVSDMQILLAAMRKDFNQPDLPFVQVQINKNRGARIESDVLWTTIREQQRTLEKKITNLATVCSVDCELDDLVHLSSESQEKIGKRAAEAMSILVGGDGVPSPAFDSFEIVRDDYVPFRVNIMVNYKHVVGKLESKGVPFGFYILDRVDGEPVRDIVSVILNENSVRLRVEIDPEKIQDYYVCYAYGNTFYCNITDSADRSLPGFGPLKIKDYLKK